jgi:hypothetical protein
MNELLPYELELNQQWIDLPLPDENMAWADMRRRLDEDERRVLPFWLTGCAGWALLAVLLLGLAWWIVRPEKWFTKKQGTDKIEKAGTAIVPVNKIEKDTSYNQSDTSVTLADHNNDSIPDNNNTGSIDIKTTTAPVKQKDKTTVTDESSTTIKTVPGNISKKKKQPGYQKKDKAADKKLPAKKNKELLVDKKDPVQPANDPADIAVQISPGGIDSPAIKQPVAIVDSLKKNPFTGIVVKDPAVDTTVADKKSKTDSSKKKPFVFSAGIGLHQQLPVAGQTFIPYSAAGRKGSLADYIPSVYFRMEKEGKWFIQTGFRYGAPQLVKEFLYSRRSDTLSIQKYNDTNTYLRKTFYHQLPLAMNYFIVPNLSIGAGIVWNKFSSAISTRDIIQVDRFNGGDTAISTGTVFNSRGADSNFVNSYFQASIELHYKWKKFSFGANYSFGLQPYIRFVLPGGVLQEEKNRSLHLFIRYEQFIFQTSSPVVPA